jgi:hypothetical protein
VIVYNLRCKNRHEFEGWFSNSSAYEVQAKGGLLACPVCDSRKVDKAPMAPAVAGTKKKADTSPAELAKMRQFMTGLRKYVQENAEYVGPKFPEEARKIHYGETDERHIYGEATIEAAKELIEEGVDVAALPPDVEGAN